MKFRYKLLKKAKVIEWYNSLKENVRAAVYIEQELGSNYQSAVHLMVNTRPNVTTIGRIGKRGLDWFELKPLKSEFINIRYFGVTGLKKKEQDKGRSPAQSKREAACNDDRSECGEANASKEGDVPDKS